MPEPKLHGNDFIIKATKVVEEHMANERFGVSELAQEVGMSRSNLLRKIKKLTNLSVSQFIRQLRLQAAFELLKNDAYTISEISYKVGFSSTSYFIKCFGNHYGYPPGAYVKQNLSKEEVEYSAIDAEAKPAKAVKKQNSKPGWNKMKWGLAVVVAISIGYFISTIDIFKIPISNQLPLSEIELEKSIAVLPFKNDSNDSTNVYLVNGLMESILANLQKIKDVRVISRTSVEKYRNHSKTIPEIAKELNVSYFVEGSGQKIKDQILLNIQLIDGETDSHLWAKQYNRKVSDIFGLQQEVAKNIAAEIEVIITPQEVERIAKIPTRNLEAYDTFLKALDLFHQENYVDAIGFYKKAIELDPEFARAYAGLSISYFMLDIFQVEKRYVKEVGDYADKAMLLDPELPQSLIAKALVYMNKHKNASALPYLEKALEISPNSALVINILSDFYANQEPNTAKYLEYALKGISLDIAAQDSSTASFTYMHVSNAFVQSGFAKEALIYIDKSLAYNPKNLYSEYLKAYVVYANNFELEETKQLLIKALEKDSTRLDIMQEVAKMFYYQRDFKNAYVYYKKFLDIREALGLDLYRHEHSKMGVVMAEVGLHAVAEKLLNDYKLFADQNTSLYRHLNLAMYYAYTGEEEKAIEHLKLFSEEKDYHYWIVLFVKIDPLIDKIKKLPEFTKTIKKIEGKFWENHQAIKLSLEEKGLV